MVVNTTRPDTIFGMSFVGVSPDHPLAQYLAKENTKIDEFGGYSFDSSEGVKLKVASFTTSTLVLSEAPTGVVVGMEVTHPQIPIGTFYRS